MKHFIFEKDLKFPKDERQSLAMFGMGCFWGAERKFWELPGVKLTAVGYAGGSINNPSYQQVCSGITGHNEVVKIFFDSNILKYEDLLKVFWENHNPTQGNRQGNDIGTQYRSAAYFYSDEQENLILTSMRTYGDQLERNGYGQITTEIRTAPFFFLAEEYHQQYLAKNPSGYCGLGGTGINLSDNVLNY